MSGKAINLAPRLKVAGGDELSPKELIDGEEKNLSGGKS